MLTRLYDLLTSWKLSVALTLTGALYFLFLAIWGARSPSHVVQTISQMSPYILFYVLLLLNTLMCVLRRLKLLTGLMSGSLIYLPDNIDWALTVQELPPIRRKPRRSGESIYWIRHRYASLGTLLLHLSLFVLAAGFSLSHFSRMEGSFTAGQGQKLTLKPGHYERTTTPLPLTRKLPSLDVTLTDIRTEFWENRLLFTRFTVDIDINGKTHHAAINDPIYLSPFLTVRLTSFGYAPQYMVLLDGMPVPLEEGAARMNIFPPGQRDYLVTQHFPHRIYLTLYPDYVETASGPISISMKLKNPRFVIEVYRGKVFLIKKTIGPGEAIPIEEFIFSVVQILPTAEFTVVRDLGIPFIFLSFILSLSGLLMRLPGRRSELMAVPSESGDWQLLGKNIPEIRT